MLRQNVRVFHCTTSCPSLAAPSSRLVSSCKLCIYTGTRERKSSANTVPRHDYSPHHPRTRPRRTPAHLARLSRQLDLVLRRLAKAKITPLTWNHRCRQPDAGGRTVRFSVSSGDGGLHGPGGSVGLCGWSAYGWRDERNTVSRSFSAPSLASLPSLRRRSLSSLSSLSFSSILPSTLPFTRCLVHPQNIFLCLPSQNPLAVSVAPAGTAVLQSSRRARMQETR